MSFDAFSNATDTDRAERWLALCGNASTNKLARAFGVSWEYAAQLMTELETRGVVSSVDQVGRRSVSTITNNFPRQIDRFAWEAACEAARILDLSPPNGRNHSYGRTQNDLGDAAQALNLPAMTPETFSVVLDDAVQIIRPALPHVTVELMLTRIAEFQARRSDRRSVGATPDSN